MYNLSSNIPESDKVMLSLAAAKRKLTVDADMFSDRVSLCMYNRVIFQGTNPRVVLYGSYIDGSRGVERQMVLNYGKCSSETNACPNAEDSVYCTFVTYITNHGQIDSDPSDIRAYRQLDDGQYIMESDRM